MRTAFLVLVLCACSEPPAQPVQSAPVAPSPSVPSRSALASTILPLLFASGCAADSCHGSGLVAPVLSRSAGEALLYDRLLSTIVPGDPDASPLYREAIGVDHIGGIVLARDGPEARALREWIEGREPAPLPARARARRAIGGSLAAPPPALAAWLRRCTGCHDEVAPRIGATEAELGDVSSPVVPSGGQLGAAITGRTSRGAPHPRSMPAIGSDEQLALFSWISSEPVPEHRPDGASFAEVLAPMLASRGCGTPSCHDDATSRFLFFGTAQSAGDDYARVVLAMERGDLVAKATNAVPHGGGRRLGGADDCVLRAVEAWWRGEPIAACPAREPPGHERYVSEIEPLLARIGCQRCHFAGLGGFAFALPDGADATEANYASVVAHLDLGYPPLSPVLLRVREPCMQSRSLAWVDGLPPPSCEVDAASVQGSFPSPASM